MADIAIVGVGAVGGAVASALLGRPEHRVTLCARRGFDRLIVVTPEGRVEHAVAVETDVGTVDRTVDGPVDVGPVRWVLLATKAHQTRGAANWLASLCAADTTIAVLQNGVEHRARVEPIAGPARVLPVVVDCPATCVEPGLVDCHRRPRMVVPDSDDGRELAELLAGAGIDCETAADFTTTAWRKLCVNVVSGAIPTLCDQPRGVFGQPPVAELARGLIRECVAVGRAEGARLADDLPERIVAGMQAGPPESLTSMLVDRRAGKQLEADARNGAVVRIGARHGIPTPLNRAVAAILGALNQPIA